MKRVISIVGGFIAGLVNGLLGAGGGMVLVPMLSKAGLETKKTHANSIAVILPISVLSSIMYIRSGSVTLSDATPYLIWGVMGSILGAFILTKINDKWLHRIFGALMIWAAVRMLLR